MDALKDYTVNFSGLKPGKHNFTFEVGKNFFENLGGEYVENGEIKVELGMDKQSTMLILDFEINGVVNRDCDRCGVELDVPVSSRNRLIVKFGSENFEETEDIVVIPHEEHQINVAQFIYEFICLAIPIRAVHSEEGPGGCDPEIIAILNKQQNESQGTNDPRWEKLKSLQFGN